MRVGENFCPGILHAVPAKDGLLMRIRVPGGLISARQLSTVAALSTAFADGQIEITSRANLQLRAIEERNLDTVVDALSAADLLPSRQHDRVRNIATSPLAGLVPEEFVDTRSLIRQLDRRLVAEDVFVELHPKFSFGIYGGGALFSREQDDLALQALSYGELFQLYLGGLDSGYAVPYEHAVDCLLDAARLCIASARSKALPARSKKFFAVPGMMECLIEALSPWLIHNSNHDVPGPIAPAPIGVHPAIHLSQRNITPVVALGRLTSKQGELLASIAIKHDGDLRLAPWRGVVLGAIPLERTAEVVSQLDSAGLYTHARSGFYGMAACAGSTGCDASLADVRSDAALIAKDLSGRTPLPGWTINLSGCEKQCAMRHGAMAELTGTSSGYLLRINGQATLGPCTPETAIDLIASAHATLFSEAAPS